MSVTSTNTVPHVSTTTTMVATTVVTQPQTGFSSVTDSISSAATESEGMFAPAIKTVSYPFVFIGGLFTDAYKGILGMFAAIFGFGPSFADKAKMAFIEDNLNNFSSADVFDEALEKFSHISNPKNRLEVFNQIQAASHISVDNTRAFYDLLPVDTQNHLERHIWIENGKNDNGLGLRFGKHIIDTDIKADLVHQAITTCLGEK